MRLLGGLIILLWGGSVWAGMQQTWSFDDLESGHLPDNWEAAETNGKGAHATWEVLTNPDA